MKEKIKSLALWLVIGVLGAAGLSGAVLALTGNFPIGIENCNNCTIALESGKEAVEGLLGASGTRFPHGISADSTSPTTGEVRGTTLTITGATTISGAGTISGTSTLGYTPNQTNVARTSFNTASTTLCSIQNTSGVDRVITGSSNAFTGTSGNGANTGLRAYVSAARADNNTAATATVYAENNIQVTSGMQTKIVGGPVPGSYYTSSTAFETRLSGVNTTTLTFWPNGWYYNVTTTAITSSTGSCAPWNYPV